MTARIAPTAAILTLVLCAPASGKGLAEVEVCGAGGCVDRTPRATHSLIEGGPRQRRARPAGPYYVVRVGFGHGDEVMHRVDKRWFPKAALLRDDIGVWVTPSPRTRRALERLTRGVEPLPAGSPPPAPAPAPPTGQLPPEVMEPPATAEDDGGGPSTALVAAPAVLLLGLAALAGRRRRRSRGA
jgi:MYXO-CTERM domain-containing protein